MKVPGELLGGMRGDKRRGITVLSLAAMVLAGLSGILWGLIAVLNPTPTKSCQVESNQPNTTINAELTKPSVEVAPYRGCGPCGAG